MEITLKEVQNIVNRFKGKSERTDMTLSENEISRIAYTALKIPPASDSEAILVDVGGTVFWLPIYTELLGYKNVIILSRPNASFANLFDKNEIGIPKGVNIEILDCDAELSKYPINDGEASCVVSFETLEHFAGDPMNLIAESNRILKENGLFCLSTPNVISNGKLVQLAFGSQPGWSTFTDSYGDRHNREYTPFEMRELLKAGGFEVSVLETFSCSTQKKKLLFRSLENLFSLPASLIGRVPLGMRKELIFVSSNKIGPVVERYPQFLYDLFGAKEVQFKIPLKYVSNIIDDSKLIQKD